MAYKRLLVAGTGSLSTKEQWNDVREFFKGTNIQVGDCNLDFQSDTADVTSAGVRYVPCPVAGYNKDQSKLGRSRS
jgi:hypothetical protein